MTSKTYLTAVIKWYVLSGLIIVGVKALLNAILKNNLLFWNLWSYLSGWEEEICESVLIVVQQSNLWTSIKWWSTSHSVLYEVLSAASGRRRYHIAVYTWLAKSRSSREDDLLFIFEVVILAAWCLLQSSTLLYF